MRLLTVMAATFVALGAVGTARADGPVITTSLTTSPLSVAPSISSTCGFNVLLTTTVYVRALSFSDEDGNLTKRIAYVSADGWVVKESTGEALPFRGVWTQIRDVAAGTVTITGLRASVQAPGKPPSAVMVGRLVLPAAGGLTPIEQTPRIDFFNWWADVCTSFSA